MNYSLEQIIEALNTVVSLNGDKEPAIEKLKEANDLLDKALDDLDCVTVAGRSTIDTLLGCMMAIEAIIGKKGNNG